MAQINFIYDLLYMTSLPLGVKVKWYYPFLAHCLYSYILVLTVFNPYCQIALSTASSFLFHKVKTIYIQYVLPRERYVLCKPGTE